MKPEQIYQDLKDLAERLGITVAEENFRRTAVKAKSGLCRVKDKDIFIIDKQKSIQDKIDLLSSCLSEMPHEDVFVVPAVRELLNR